MSSDGLPLVRRRATLPDGLLLCDARLLRLSLSGCRIEQPAGSSDAAIDAVGFTARGMSLVDAAVTADSPVGAVNLAGAHIGMLICDRATLINTAGPALVADEARIDHNVFLRDGAATGRSELGTIRLSGAHLGSLHCAGTTVINTTGPALVADGAQADLGLFLHNGFTATAASEFGAVRLVGAHLGRLECDAAELTNCRGPALDADRMQVDQDVFLRNGFTATTRSELGAIRLMGARLGSLHCDGATLTNTAGQALAADGAQADLGLFLREGFTATAASERGAVRLVGAHLGRVDCDGATLTNTAGPALDAEGVRTDQNMSLDADFTGAGDGAVIALVSARIGGHLWLDTDGLHHVDAGPLVDLDGMTYTGMPQPDPLPSWLRLLRTRTPAYAAQPYQQLAAVHRAAGHDHAVRRILMAQRDDQIRRALRGRDRAWARFTGVILGHGYQPWRALLILLAVLTLSVGWTWTAGRDGGLAHTSRTTSPASPCTATELIGVGLDLGTPLLRTGARDICAPTATTAGQTLTIGAWLLQILAWGFAALFVAGFTGAIRKT